MSFLSWFVTMSRRGKMGVRWWGKKVIKIRHACAESMSWEQQHGKGRGDLADTSPSRLKSSHPALRAKIPSHRWSWDMSVLTGRGEKSHEAAIT